MFLDHSRIKLVINNRRKIGKFMSTWKLNKILLNNEWVMEKNHTRNKKLLADYLKEKLKAVLRGKLIVVNSYIINEKVLKSIT